MGHRHTEVAARTRASVMHHGTTKKSLHGQDAVGATVGSGIAGGAGGGVMSWHRSIVSWKTVVMVLPEFS